MNKLDNILLVEDDMVDQMTVQRALKEVEFTGALRIANNGEEALEMLRAADGFRPDIIVSDLNMPRMGGIDFLTVLKDDETLRSIPVIVLTTSKEDRDRIESFDLSVAGYVVKPVNYDKFREVMRTIAQYWNFSERAQ